MPYLHRLRLPIALLASLVMVLMAAGAGMLVWQAREAVLSEAHAVHRGTARAVSRHVFHVIRSSAVLLDQMLAEVNRKGGIAALRRDDSALHETLRQLVRPLSEVNTALIADGNGNLVGSNHFFPVPEINYTDRAWFLAHLTGQDFVIGPPVVGRTSGASIITISKAVRDADGHILAAALVGVEIGYLEQLFADIHTDDGRAVTLFLRDGTLIARNPPEPPGRQYPNAPAVRLADSEPSGSRIIPNTAIDGQERLNAWDRVGDYPLVVVAGQSMERLLAPWRAFAWQVGLLLMVMLVALTLAARFVLVSIRREEAALAAAERNAKDLARANESLSSVLAAAPEGIVGIDAADRVIFVNDAALRLTGYDRDDMIDQVLHDLVHHHRADGSPYPAAECAMRNGVRDAELCTIADEVFWRKDGSSFPVEYTAGRLDLPGGGHGCVVVFRDIGSRRRMEDELKRSNTDLEQFAYAVSHDLQEPLRTISGFVGLLKRGFRDKLPDEAVEYIDMAVDGVMRMSRMIDDLLAYSRIGRTDITPEAVDLGRCAARARDSLLAAIDETNATVELGPLPVVAAIETQMVSLFQNLLSNAIKYADPSRPPHITVTTRRAGGDWIIRVADNGLGIVPADRERVFQVFQRLHKRGISGSGVGLALCRRIVERHRGAIWIEGREDGQPGSVFALRLPAV
ncbi:MAG: ATP-binding protein [Magnetospirillum sp.]|nr:ATP-binding protein [Magnetospirillum sp.]